jgi:putative transposase
VRNVLGALPRSVHPAARRALNEILAAEDRSHAERAIEAFAAEFGVKWPKAVAKVTDDADSLLTFYDYPAEHWGHLKTSNPIWVFSLPTSSRYRSVRWPVGGGSGPDSESDCCCSMDAFELEVSGAVTGREAIDGLA